MASRYAYKLLACSFSFFSQPLAKDMGPLFICCLAAEMNYLVTNMNVCIPCNFDGSSDALMGGTAFRVHPERSFCGFKGLRRHGKIIMKS